jgi:epoxyqueuosine reductase
MRDPALNSELIKKLAKQSGFLFCGISKAGFLEEEAERMDKWLKQGYQGEMKYLENHFEKRMDPRLLVPGAKTVVSLMYNYYPSEKQAEDTFKIAKYAYGADYHDVVKEKLRLLMEDLRREVGTVEGRAFVDSAPVMERAWAEKGGLGWIGKHGLLINKAQGSFFFLAELIIDLDCAPDGPVKDFCGSCNRCVDACPTEAILPGKTLDASKCISYLTIELKNAIPEEFTGKMNDWIFGCDICQDVCPWNRFSQTHTENQFKPETGLLEMNREQWREISETVFASLFSKSAVKRTGYSGLSRNIRFAGRPAKD